MNTFQNTPNTQTQTEEIAPSLPEPADYLPLLRGIMNCMQESVVALDTSMCFLEFNQTFEKRFLGAFGKQVALGMNLLELLADVPEERDLVGGLWKRALDGETFTVVREFGKPHLNRQVSETSYSCLRDKEGHIIGAVHVSRDVTARVRAEEALKRSNALLAETQSTAHVGSWEFDVIAGQVLWSEELFHIMEFDPAEGIPPYDRFLARFHPEDVSLFLTMEEYAIKVGEPRDFEIRVRYSDGRQGWLHVLGRSIKNAEGQVIRTLGTVRDITESKHAELARREIDARFQAFMDNGSFYAWITDVEGKIFYSNAPFARLFQMDAASLIGKSSFDIVSAREARTHLENNRKVLETGQVVQTVEEGTVADGTERYGLVSKFPVEDETYGMLVGGIAIDITEQRRLEEQLQQARKMETIGQLAGGIAHDFNNLLAVIIGYAEMIEHDLPAKSAAHAKIRNITTAAARASSLTHQLLTFARRQPAEPRVIVLTEFLREMSSMLKTLVGEDNRIVIHLEPQTKQVRIDPDHMEQVLVNLVVNARDAMPAGGTLTIQTKEVLLEQKHTADRMVIPAGHYISLSVSDTGTGMTEAVKTRLFEPFFTTKEVGKGTGLGLATVYGIVQQSDGYILVESEVGKGTTFTVYLPCVEARAEATGAPTESPAVAPKVETVLVVEDEPILREMAVLMLRRNKYRVLEAADGVEALRVAREFPEPIHLLLTDAIMPNMGGRELVEQLRQQRPNIPVLVASGYTADRFADAELSLPGVSFLAKPYTPSLLLAKVREALREKSFL